MTEDYRRTELARCRKQEAITRDALDHAPTESAQGALAEQLEFWNRRTQYLAGVETTP